MFGKRGCLTENICLTELYLGVFTMDMFVVDVCMVDVFDCIVSVV